MAGAGYKLFNTGDVLTAAQVNTYLMEQTVMVFADAAARTTALTGVVSEGMISYLKDTNAVEVYNGSAWVASDDPNAIQNTIVDAKGDLITATAADTPARLAVGNNGETLVADSSASTGLRWSPPYVAGKNKVLNADFNINQRGFTSTTTEFTYGVDRFFMRATGGTNTYSVQSFTPGDAPIAQYEGRNYVRLVSSGQSGTGDRTILRTYIEGARTLANQTVTISFWARAASGTPNICPSIFIHYGTGGSPSANIDWNLTTKKTITTSWVRYSFTGTMPSLSGKTFGTNNNDYIALDIAVSAGSTLTQFDGIGLQSNTFDIWGLQLEAGSAATAFQTATGTLAGELAACQRYYWRNSPAVTDIPLGQGSANGTRYVLGVIALPVSMRVAPTSADFSALKVTDGVNAATTVAALASYGNSQTTATYYFDCTSGLTQYRNYKIETSSSSGYLGFSAEL